MSTALYRRYRPESFADVIGQEHVTEPLMTALANDRVNHAYLFSGPRGCGKTTSARILARCLNCVEGPTPTPCGKCDSCRELSRDGGGSLDVIEMDAASHGGVDHARDLRERATFAPVRDRYKIFIIDEAHMVTREGFNALLKIVEEPPEHIKFIFATTEPNKVLGTIRSRTHHYPFRLVPPETLLAYLQKLCDEEGVQVEDGVLPLVVRAGGGSVRDSLSILDQLMAGSDDRGITYDLAVALLGFTHGELLDEVVSAFASGNAAEVFAAVDRVVQTGQDPRRFVEDLLERFRDLIIVQAVPDSAQAILRGMSQDQLTRLREQAEMFGHAELSRAADTTNSALNEMSGATSPQLHLELLCARILLPASEKTIGGVGARLDRLERRVANGDFPAAAGAGQGVSGGQGSAAGSGQDAGERPSRRPRPSQPQDRVAPQQDRAQTDRTQPDRTQPDRAVQPQHPGQAPEPAQPQTAPLANLRREQQAGATQTPAQETGSRGPVQSPSGSQGSPGNQGGQGNRPRGNNTVQMVANAWQEVVGHVQSPQARTWFARCTPSKFEGGALYIRADITTLRRVKDHIAELKTALHEVLQLEVDIHAEVDKSGNPSRGPQGAPKQTPPHEQQPASRPQPTSSEQSQQAPQQSSQRPQQGGASAPIAEGPRGGEEAWRAHGQPRTNEAPQWSTEDWNNPVTDWEVASIPNDDAPLPEEPPQDEPPYDDPNPETGPQLRVIEGEAGHHSPEEEAARENHPSSGRWRRPDISAAPDAEDAKETDADRSGQSSPPNEGEPNQPNGPDSADVPHAPNDQPADQDEAAHVPEGYTPNTGIADGSVEPADPEHSNIPDPDPSAGEVEADPGNPRGSATEERSQDFSQAPNGGAQYNEMSEGVPPLAGGTPPLGRAPLAPGEPQGEQPGSGAPGHEGASGRAEVSGGTNPGETNPAHERNAGQRPGGRRGFRERFAAQIEGGQRAVQQNQRGPAAGQAPEEFTASDDDEALESAVLIGQRAVEKILGGVVIEEKLHGQ
ncbi:DNA polymerase III subunit gamma and tau [Rothia sp. LK2588]|uniref:DNA polymerase III subunit gamma and tau n=1 Tax=Rothia sp. LK2588 TaxID=3114369 RepID=UPI0034CD811C